MNIRTPLILKEERSGMAGYFRISLATNDGC
jgi:hypothetical protein